MYGVYSESVALMEALVMVGTWYRRPFFPELMISTIQTIDRTMNKPIRSAITRQFSMWRESQSLMALSRSGCFDSDVCFFGVAVRAMCGCVEPGISI